MTSIMNCEDFKGVVHELANDELMDAEARQQGLRHTAVCAHCASRLSAAKSVRAILQMAASAESEEAPARVKQSLLAAFSEPANVAVTAAPVIEISSRRRLRWFGVAALAAAAVLLIALILPSLLKVSKPAPRESARVQEVNPISPAATPERKPDERAAPPLKNNSLAARNTFRASGPRTIARVPRVRDRVEKNATEASTKKNTNEYFPLTYLDSATAMESGTVVRVQLSRSALMSLGLPLNIERADGLIRADLVIGDDGVARAIRLVE